MTRNNMNLEQIKAAVRSHELEVILPDHPRFTAVMIPLVEMDGEWHVLFQVRSDTVDQPGEVSFPGGHVEPGETARQAAVRETCEELLVSPEQVELLAPMHRMADRGRLVIDSFLGVVHDYQGSFLEEEVARIFTVPLNRLMEREPDIYEIPMKLSLGDDFPWELIPGGKSYPFIRIPRRFYFYHEEEIIWGITGELLYQAIKLLKESTEYDEKTPESTEVRTATITV